MSVTITLIDALREHAEKNHKNPTDYQVAKLLNVSTSRMGNWVNERSGMSKEAISDAVNILYEDDVEKWQNYWILLRQKELEQNEDIKSVWQRLADKVAMLALPLVLAVGLLGSPKHTQAASAFSVQNNIYYVKSN